jgi:hypothetical protein
MRAKSEGLWWFLSYPALLCAYAYGVTCADKDIDWWQSLPRAMPGRVAGDRHRLATKRFPVWSSSRILTAADAARQPHS